MKKKLAKLLYKPIIWICAECLEELPVELKWQQLYVIVEHLSTNA